MTLLDFMFSDMSPFKRKTKYKLNERSLGFMFCLPSQDFNLVFFVFCFFWTSVKYLVSSKTDMKEKKKKSLISEVVVKTV